jgi:hypothetical protein
VSTSVTSETVIDGVPGDRLRATVTLTNDGDGDGMTDVNLTGGGEVVDSIKVHVGSGESRTVRLGYTVEETGSFDVGVGETSVGTVEVEQAGAAEPPSGSEVSILGLTAAESVSVGTTVDVEATFENTGDERVTFDARLLIDGESAAVEDLSVPAGRRRR